MSGLKNFGTTSGSGSIQILVHTACQISLPSATAETGRCGLQSVTIYTGTPIAFRNGKLGHPPLPGNYTALADFSATFDGIKSQTVFHVTSKHDSYIYLITGWEAAKRPSGMLGSLPPSPYLITRSFIFEGSRVTLCPTVFVTCLTQQGMSSLRYRGSVAVSHLRLLKVNELPQTTERNLQALWFPQ